MQSVRRCSYSAAWPGFELWGGAHGRHAALIRELGATPIDYQREDFTRVLPGGFDVVFDGIGEDGYRRSFAALKPGGLLCAYGYSAGVQGQRRMLTMLMWIARLYLWRWLPGGRRAFFYSINAMRLQHPAWFIEDLKRLFALLASGAIQPRVAERISLDEVAEAHRRLEAAVSRASSCCARIFRRDATSVPPDDAVGLKIRASPLHRRPCDQGRDTQFREWDRPAVLQPLTVNGHATIMT